MVINIYNLFTFFHDFWLLDESILKNKCKTCPVKKNIFVLISKNVTGIYVFQWLIIPISIIIIKYVNKSTVFSDLSVTLIALFVVFASTLCSLSFKKLMGLK